MRRVAIFGCSADPFTVAHREICRSVLTLTGNESDKLYVIPTIVDYHRKGKSVWLDSIEKRKCIEHMLWSMGPEYIGRWEIDCHELRLKTLCQHTDDNDCHEGLCDEIVKQRRFIHTLLDFRCRHDDVGYISLVLGSDSVRNLMTWNKWKSVLANVNEILMVQGRDGKEVKPSKGVVERLTDGVTPIEIDSALANVSASKVREKYAKHGFTMDEYLYDVHDYDKGELSLEELGWSSPAKGE